MNKNNVVGILFTGLLFYSLTSYSQSDCKVLYENINESYAGKCKKGLAHGNGIAKGKDTYEGSFRKGIPHGQGTYTYSEGDVYSGAWKDGERHGKGTYADASGGKYEGNWKAGVKHGEGTYYVQLPERDTTYIGIWKDDEYVGPKPEATYKITYKRSVDRVNMIRIGDGNRLIIKLQRSGMRNTMVENYRFEWSSGNEIDLRHAKGWENLEFPFEGKITYTTPNKLGTSTFTVQVGFVINEPGEWELILHN